MYYGQKLTAEECFGLVKTQLLDGKPQSEELNISSIDLKNKKSVVVLCGNNTKNPMKAAAYTNYYFGWINEFEDKSKVSAYSVYYPSEQPLFVSLHPNPSLNYAELARIMFDPIIFDGENPQSVKNISEQLGDVTFFGHSAGGFVMNELMFHLGARLKEQGFSDEDINKIYSSIVFVGYSPYALVDAPINSIYVAPIYDSVGSTKLVYDRMIQNKGVISSKPEFDISNTCKFRASSYSSFFKLYETAIKNENSIYFVDNKSLIATPNLLFYDGLKEDHNLAGVIDYPGPHPYKTEAGIHTTEFLHKVFNYCLSTERNRFSVNDIYKIVAQKSTEQSTDTPTTKNKEL